MRYSFIAALLFWAFSSNSAHSRETPPPVMYQFLSQVLQLQPYIFTADQKELQKNRASIQRHLKELARQAEGLGAVHQLNTPYFKVSSDILLDQIRTASLAFERGQLAYAQRMLRTTLYACSSCHAQVPSSQGALWRFEDAQLSGSPFQRAEFLYATRQYDAALKLYKSVARHYGSLQNRHEMDKALGRILAIRLRGQSDVTKAISDLEEIEANPRLPNDTLAALITWKKELQKIRGAKKINPKSAKTSELLAFAKKMFDPRQSGSRMEETRKAEALYLSGLLYDHLQTQKDQKISPELFYWLSLYENALGDYLPFEMSQFLLRECVRRNPGDPIAVDCFKEYEEQVRLDFTGSAGEDVPADIEREIRELKQLMKKK